MCGIVGAVAQRDVVDILVEGLRRLEYRGYDSAGVAVINNNGELQRLRRLGKVKELADAVAASPTPGGTGIAHTRWATHGEPSERNAHPHVSHDGHLEDSETLVARSVRIFRAHALTSRAVTISPSGTSRASTWPTTRPIS